MAINSVVLAVPVVEMRPAGERSAALIGVPVRTPVGPLTQCGLDEALGLAVGLRPIGPRELLRDAQLKACFAEGCRVEYRAVVGEDSPPRR